VSVFVSYIRPIMGLMYLGSFCPCSVMHIGLCCRKAKCHDPVLYQNSETCCQNCFTASHSFIILVLSLLKNPHH